MESIIRDVTALDENQRSTLEGVLGRVLFGNERLVISIVEAEAPLQANGTIEKPPQSLADWTSIYAGMSDDQIELIDAFAKSRATLTGRFD